MAKGRAEDPENAGRPGAGDHLGLGVGNDQERQEPGLAFTSDDQLPRPVVVVSVRDED